MSNVVQTIPDNQNIDLDSLPMTFQYTGSNVTSITINHPNGNIYKQTFTYSGSNVESISPWEKQ